MRRGAVDRRVDEGSLIRVHAGIYRVGHAAPSGRAQALAAVLACGDEFALFGRWAAGVWGLRQIRAGELVEVA